MSCNIPIKLSLIASTSPKHGSFISLSRSKSLHITSPCASFWLHLINVYPKSHLTHQKPEAGQAKTEKYQTSVWNQSNHWDIGIAQDRPLFQARRHVSDTRAHCTGPDSSHLIWFKPDAQSRAECLLVYALQFLFAKVFAFPCPFVTLLGIPWILCTRVQRLDINHSITIPPTGRYCSWFVIWPGNAAGRILVVWPRRLLLSWARINKVTLRGLAKFLCLIVVCVILTD